MNKFFVFTLAIMAVNYTFADNSKNNNAPKVDPHHLLSPHDCQEMKQGIGFFLGVADQRFKEIEAQGKNKKSRDEKWGEAIALSQLAANYSTVYQTWCAD